MGLVYLMEGEDQKAIEWLLRAALEAPNAGPAALLASADASVGREQEAHEALGHHLKLWPDTTLKSFARRSEPPSSTARRKERCRDCDSRGSLNNATTSTARPPI